MTWIEETEMDIFTTVVHSDQDKLLSIIALLEMAYPQMLSSLLWL